MAAAGGWVAFGLFTIVCSAIVALHADKLAHRQRQAVLTDYFEHILQLPLTFHTGTHSGTLMKTMLSGTDALWRLWLGFFREHFAAIMSVVVLLPLSLYINWQLAILLFALCVVFTFSPRWWCARPTACRWRSRSTTAISPRAPPTRSAMSRWCRASCASIPRCRACASSPTSCSPAQMPVLSWWALVTVITRASTTITVLAIFTVGIALHSQGPHHRSARS
jgi:ATP-binding cassette subfamily B protein